MAEAPVKQKLKKVSCDLSELFKKIIVTIPVASYGQSGKFVCDWDGVVTFVKFAPYLLLGIHRWAEVPGTMNAVDVEIQIMKLFKEEILDKGYTPHIIELYDTVICDKLQPEIIKECEAKALSQTSIKRSPIDSVCSFYENLQAGRAISKYALIFSEPCIMTLNVLLRSHLPVNEFARTELLRAIIFQIWYTFEVIHRVFPSFKHHDMHLNNILVAVDSLEKIDPYHQKYIRYEIDSVVFNVPYYGFTLKIIDFGLSELPERNIRNIDSIKSIPKDEIKNERVADYWDGLSDIARFIIELCTVEVGDRAFHGLATIINPMSLLLFSAPRMLHMHQDSILSVMSTEVALAGKIFEPLRINIDDGDVITQYRAPDKANK